MDELEARSLEIPGTGVFFHTGFTKAASTTLQSFFAKHPKLAFVDRYQTYKKLVARTSLEYDHQAAESFIVTEASRAASEQRVPVFSHERLSGNPHSGHYDAKEIADRIHGVVPKAKVILCIREQIGMISSCYKQYIRIGGTKTLQEYLFPRWQYRIPLFNYKAYEYHQLISYYYQVFGKEQVAIVVFEDLVGNPTSFYRGLCAFLGVHFDEKCDIYAADNPGVPDSEVESRRLTNFFETKPTAVRDPNPFGNLHLCMFLLRLCVKARMRLLRAGERDLRDEVRSLVSGYFAESNRETGKLIEVDLGTYGYEV